MARKTNSMNFEKSSLCLLVLYLGFSSASASIGKFTEIDLAKGEGRVEFLAIGKPSAIKIRGKGGPLQGKVGVTEQGISGLIDMDLNTLDTGIGLRDTHMKEKYLKTGEYPKAQLSIVKVALPPGWLTQIKKFKSIDFEGKLKLHGQEKPITGKLSFNNDGKFVDGSAQFKVKITDFGIEVPSYAGITVTDEVEIQTFFKSPIGAKD